MKAAHCMQVNYPAILVRPYLNKSQALKYAWWFEDFRKKLQNGIYDFSYIKTDGTIREARGTLCIDLIPEEYRPKGDMSDGAAHETAPGVFPYFDFLAQGWRSFRCDNFIGFITQVY